jgi:NADPH:quinone reductase-like Zn-dependent oxidoreductase
VDIVIDPVDGTTTARSWPVLRSGGTLVAIAAEPDPGSESRAGVGAAYFVGRPDGGQLRELASLVGAGRLRPATSAAFDWAHCRRPSGRPPGKVIIRVGRTAHA